MFEEMFEDWKCFLVEVIFPVAIFFLPFTLLYAIAVIPPQFFLAKTESQLYNQKFGTHYTVSQFFWAGDTIKEFLNQGKQTVQNIKIEGSIPVRISE